MTVYTKTAADVFAPTTSGGAARGASMEDAQLWGTEVERGIDAALSIANPSLYLQKAIVLLGTGQSNMAGAGTGGDATKNSHVFAWDHAQSKWVTAEIGVAPFDLGGNNLLFHAGKTVQEATGRDVYLILSALGGQSIDRWVSSDGDPSRWTDLTTQVASALASSTLTNLGVSYVDRVLWHQGEQDATMRAFVYRGKLLQVRNQMRARVWWKSGHTFMIAGELCDCPAFDTFKQGQTFGIRLAAETEADIAVASSFGFVGRTDSTGHFTGAELVEYGKRYGQICLAPFAPTKTPTQSRHAPGNIYFTVDPAGNGDFDNFEYAFNFFNTISLGPAARAQVTFAAGTYDAPSQQFRINLRQGEQWEFVGTLAGNGAPAKGAFTGTKATDYSMLAAEYLTVFSAATTVLVLGGGNCGYWENFLFAPSSPGTGTIGIRSWDATISRNDLASTIHMKNCVFHGWDSTSATAMSVRDGASLRMIGAIFSYCTNALTVESSRVHAPDALYIQCTKDVTATQSAQVNSGNSKTTQSGGTSSFTASTNAYIDARNAENKSAKTELTGGKVET